MDLVEQIVREVEQEHRARHSGNKSGAYCKECVVIGELRRLQKRPSITVLQAQIDLLVSRKAKLHEENRQLAGEVDRLKSQLRAPLEMTFRSLQEEQRAWARHNFPDQAAYMSLLGAVEELGELAHAHLKQEQGIRGTAAEHEEKAKDAVADVVIFLSDYCSKRGFEFQAIIEKTWAEVKKRDWRKNPLDADQKAAE